MEKGGSNFSLDETNYKSGHEIQMTTVKLHNAVICLSRHFTTTTPTHQMLDKEGEEEARALVNV